jgi:ribonuclease-3
VRLGRGERRSGGARKERILGNLFEAVTGALYLDGGLPAVVRFLRGQFGEAVEGGGAVPAHDPKTHFQEWCVARHQEFPQYAVTVDSGVENDPRRFTVAVTLAGERRGEGRGRTKRDAEQAAAGDALRRAGVTS